MKITLALTDSAVLEELGARLNRQRIEAGLTQVALAEQAGISKRTLERIEAGHGAELVSLIRLLRVLGLADGLDLLVPESSPSPMALLKGRGKQRKRAPRSRKAVSASVSSAAPPTSWKWGE